MNSDRIRNSRSFLGKLWIPIVGLTALTVHICIYILPPFEPLRATFSEFYSVIPLRALTLAVLIPGIARLSTSSERAFWMIVIAALASWYVTDVMFYSGLESNNWRYVLEDLGVVLFYPLMIMAIEQRPHRFHLSAPVGGPRWYCMLAAGALILWCYCYLVVCALVSDSSAYQNATPSYAFYFVIDTMLTIVLLHRAWIANGRWRNLYLTFAMLTSSFMAGDLIETLVYAEVLSIPYGTLVDFVWITPYFVLMFAAWYRNRTAQPAFSGPEMEEEAARSMTRTAIAYTCVIPLVHFGVYFMRWQPEYLSLREVVAGLGFLLLLVLTWFVFLKEKQLVNSSKTRVLLLDEDLQQTQKLEALGRLAGGIAHDFNNLLLIVQANVDLMSRQLKELDGGAEFIQQLESTVQQGSGLTRQLLAFGRRQVSEPHIVNVNSIIGDTEILLRRTLGEQVELSFDPEPKLWPAKVDPGQLTQILINLALNARDAMPDGGKLTIRTANVQLEESAPSRFSGPFVEIDVIDTGKGMNEETMQHVFDPFFTTRRDTGGSGLGLSVVYGIVRQCGGRISCQSFADVGTSFRIHIPKATGDPEDSVLTDGELDPTRPDSATILLAEDEFEVRRLTSEYLRQAGYNVIDAEDGKQGLDKLKSLNGSVDVLVTDVVMPGVGGVEFAKAVHTISPDTRVLFVSGYAKDVEPDQLEDHSFLQKPYSMAQLENKLRQVLGDRNNRE